MGHLVRQHAGNFGFVVGGLDESGMHVHRAAGERKGVDGILVHQLEIVRVGIGLRGFRKLLADLVQPDLDFGALHYFHLAFHLRGGLFAELQFLVAGQRSLLDFNVRLFRGPFLRVGDERQ